MPDPIRERLESGSFVLIDKPRGPSSHQVTSWVRDLLGVSRAGHAGTLDPNVSGLLWIGVGPALKLIPLLLEFPKRYIALIALHGEAAQREIERVVAEFTGPIFQTPPVRSAVRRERRTRTIRRLLLVERVDRHLLVDVEADSGTYIRSLAVDLGEALGVGGHLEELRRTGTGPFRATNAMTLSALADAVALAKEGDYERLLVGLHTMEEVVSQFPKVLVKEGAAAAVAHGADLAAPGIASLPQPFDKGGTVVLTTRTGALVAFGTSLYDSTEIPSIRKGWVIDCRRVFADPANFPVRWRRRPVSSPTEA